MKQNKMCHYGEQLKEYKKIESVLDIRNIPLTITLTLTFGLTDASKDWNDFTSAVYFCHERYLYSQTDVKACVQPLEIICGQMTKYIIIFKVKKHSP